MRRIRSPRCSDPKVAAGKLLLAPKADHAVTTARAVHILVTKFGLSAKQAQDMVKRP